MLVADATDQLLCRVFIHTLNGLAQQWFMSLPPSSIHSFEDLAECFRTHFASSMKAKNHLAHLSTVKQGESEALRAFIARWQKEVQSVEGLDDKLALTMLIEALHLSNMYINLRMDTPASYSLVIRRANIFTDTKEAVHQKKRQVGSFGSKRPRHPEPGRFDH